MPGMEDSAYNQNNEVRTGKNASANCILWGMGLLMHESKSINAILFSG